MTSSIGGWGTGWEKKILLLLDAQRSQGGEGNTIHEKCRRREGK